MKLRSVILASTFLIPGVALAADLPRRSAPVIAPVAPIFTWTGFYVGAHAGFAVTSADGSVLDRLATTGVLTNAARFGGEDTNFIGGIQAGYNAQFGNFVAGLEADVGYIGIDQTFIGTGVFAGTRATVEGGFYGTVRGRLGVAFDRFLPYITGGVAFADIERTAIDPPFSFSKRDTRAGFAVGAGVEYAFTNNLTFKAEYLYMQFEGRTFAAPTLAGINTTIKFDDVETHVGRVGLNYKF